MVRLGLGILYSIPLLAYFGGRLETQRSFLPLARRLASARSDQRTFQSLDRTINHVSGHASARRLADENHVFPFLTLTQN